MEKKLKRGLCLSGGGSHGSYEVGVLKALSEKGKTWNHVSGVSVGAINGVFVAMHKPEEQANAIAELEQLWLSEIKGNSSVYKPWYFFPFNYVASFWKGSLNHTKPLEKLINKHVDEDKLKASGVTLRIGAASLLSGNYLTATEATRGLARWVLASSSMPLIFNPTKIDDDLLVDGGIRDITPLSDIIDLGLDEIDVVLADTLAPMPKSKDNFNNMLNVAKRSMSVMIDEIYRSDIVYCKNEKMHTVKINIYAPNQALNFESFDFSPEKLKAAMELGHKETLEKL
jgi:NTE family protein